jgi:hypothetical protein
MATERFTVVLVKERSNRKLPEQKLEGYIHQLDIQLDITSTTTRATRIANMITALNTMKTNAETVD